MEWQSINESFAAGGLEDRKAPEREGGEGRLVS